MISFRIIKSQFVLQDMLSNALKGRINRAIFMLNKALFNIKMLDMQGAKIHTKLNSNKVDDKNIKSYSNVFINKARDFKLKKDFLVEKKQKDSINKSFEAKKVSFKKQNIINYSRYEIIKKLRSIKKISNKISFNNKIMQGYSLV